VAAAYATLSLLERQPVLETIAKRGQRLMDGLKMIFAEAGVPACFNGYPAMFSFALGVETVTNQRDWNESEKGYYLRLVEAAIERGVMPDHDPREPWFLCYSHGDTEIDETLNVMQDVVKSVKM
jgi:glutamate-1-semialdehyde aminotransferase